MKKVLLIEDNPDVRENTAEILEISGYNVETAENGKEGVKTAREFEPDVIVCDIMMPELDGYGVLHILNKSPKTASIPFIFLTAKAEKSDFRKGMNLGADDYLTKPFEEMDLLDTIERRLERSEMLRREFGEKEGDELNDFIDTARGLKDFEDLPKDRDTRSYKKKDMIYLEGSYPNALYFINKGKVKSFRTNEDGKELITGIQSTGEFVGYLALMQESSYSDSAMAMEETELAIIPKDEFFKLLHSNRDVANRFIKMLSKNIAEKEEQLLQLAYDSVRMRVAEGLIKFLDKYQEENDTGGMPVSRDDLAKVVGTSTETVIRTLSDFKDEGLISVSGRRIKVDNRSGLEHLKF